MTQMKRVDDKRIVSDRIFSFDVIRIVAICAVVMLHVSCDYVTGFNTSTNEFIIGNIIDSMTRMGVPLFIMLSGSLMLNEYKTAGSKSILFKTLKLFIILTIWAVIYSISSNVYNAYIMQQSLSIKSLIHNAVFGHVHLWYMYMIIGLYLFTPILRCVVKKANYKIILYYVLLTVLMKFALPVLNAGFNAFSGTEDIISRYADQFYLGYFSEWVCYYVLGWYVTNVEIKKKYRVLIYSLGILSLLTIILGTQIFTAYINGAYDFFYDNKNIFVFLYSVAVFVFIHYSFKDKMAGRNKEELIIHLSKQSFGVYLIHLIILPALQKLIVIENVLVAIIVIWCLTMLISYFCVYIMSKIPIVKLIIKS